MSAQAEIKPIAAIHKGMPELDTPENRVTSFFEFWPVQLIYLPVVFQWLWLSLRYRSLSLPLVANPSIPLAGMVGESKSAVLKLAGKQAASHIAPFICLQNNHAEPVRERVGRALEKIKQANIDFPLIAKPDIGCRGAGVRIIHNRRALKDYLIQFPDGAKLLLQKKIKHEAEAGIFYIRYPGQSRGKIFSITLKYAPYVNGDGVHSLQHLIEKDPRASKIAEIYFNRHRESLQQIIADKMAFRLAFAGSHCRGSIFRNGNAHITPALSHAFDEITADIKDFYYGRFDVRFESIAQLKQGHAFTILEINGAASEATHIWDKNSSLAEVYRTLFYQYKTLFRIGSINRRNGHKLPSILQLFKAWRTESKLVKQYPETD